MGSPTLQTHQYPILLLPWLWFEVADQTLTHLATTHQAGVPSFLRWHGQCGASVSRAQVHLTLGFAPSQVDTKLMPTRESNLKRNHVKLVVAWVM
jgi:hypothetical protein